MNTAQICLEKILPALKKLNSGFRMTRIPGLPGIWFDCDNVSFVLTELENGDLFARQSVANTLIGNEYAILSTPFDFMDWVKDNLASWLEIPVHGRTTTKSEEYELLYGTLSNTDPDLILQNGESNDFSDALTEPLKARLITI